MSLEVVSDYFDYSKSDLIAHLSDVNRKVGLVPEEVINYLKKVVAVGERLSEKLGVNKEEMLDYLIKVNESVKGNFNQSYDDTLEFIDYFNDKIIHVLDEDLNLASSVVDKYNHYYRMNSDSLLISNIATHMVANKLAYDKGFDELPSDDKYLHKVVKKELENIFIKEGFNGVNSFLNNIALEVDGLEEKQLNVIKSLIEKVNKRSYSDLFKGDLKKVFDEAKGYIKRFKLSFEEIVSKDYVKEINSFYKGLQSKIKPVIDAFNKIKNSDIEESLGPMLRTEFSGLKEYLIGSKKSKGLFEKRYEAIDGQIRILNNKKDGLGEKIYLLKNSAINSSLSPKDFDECLVPAIVRFYNGLKTPVEFIDKFVKVNNDCSLIFKQEPEFFLKNIRKKKLSDGPFVDRYLGFDTLEDHFVAMHNMKYLAESFWRAYPNGHPSNIRILVVDIGGQISFRIIQGPIIQGTDLVFYINSLDELERLGDLFANKHDIIPFVKKELGDDPLSAVLLTKVDKLSSSGYGSDLSEFLDFSNFYQSYAGGLEGYFNDPLFVKTTSAVLSTINYGVKPAVCLSVLLLNELGKYTMLPDYKIMKMLFAGPGLSGKSTFLRALMYQVCGEVMENYGRTERFDTIGFDFPLSNFLTFTDKSGGELAVSFKRDEKGKTVGFRVFSEGDNKSTELDIKALPAFLERQSKLNFELFLDMAITLNPLAVKVPYDHFLSRKSLKRPYLLNPLILSKNKENFENYVEELDFKTIQGLDEILTYRGCKNLLEFGVKHDSIFNLTRFINNFSEELGINKRLLIDKIKPEFEQRLSQAGSNSLEGLFNEVMVSFYKDFKLVTEKDLVKNGFEADKTSEQELQKILKKKNLEQIMDRLKNIVTVELDRSLMMDKLRSKALEEGIQDISLESFVDDFLSQESFNAMLQKFYAENIDNLAKDSDQLIKEVAERLCVSEEMLRQKLSS